MDVNVPESVRGFAGETSVRYTCDVLVGIPRRRVSRGTELGGGEFSVEVNAVRGEELSCHVGLEWVRRIGRIGRDCYSYLLRSTGDLLRAFDIFVRVFPLICKVHVVGDISEGILESLKSERVPSLGIRSEHHVFVMNV